MSNGGGEITASLKALLDGGGASKIVDHDQSREDENNNFRFIPVDSIVPGYYQPRKTIAEQSIGDLANSIKEHGIIQPIILRKNKEGTCYEIIAGERRWRAAKFVGLDVIPAVIRKISDESSLAFALIENIQREELNVIDEAIAIERLINEFSLTHEGVAKSIGRSRTTVTNILRLLKLSDETKELLSNGQIEMGHARALLSVEINLQHELANMIVAKGLSVRQTESFVKQTQESPKKAEGLVSEFEEKSNEVEKRLSSQLTSRVHVSFKNNGKCKVTIHFDSIENLDNFVGKVG